MKCPICGQKEYYSERDDMHFPFDCIHQTEDLVKEIERLKKIFDDILDRMEHEYGFDEEFESYIKILKGALKK